MEEKSEFEKTLEAGVVKEKTPTKSDELLFKREHLIKAIEEMENNVIKDPKSIKEAKKELTEVEKTIEQGELTANAKESDEKDKDEEVKRKENKEPEEQLKDDTDLGEEEKAKKEENKKQLQLTYHEAMTAMYEKRMTNIRRQLNNHEFLIPKEEYEQELILESKMYEARDAYLQLGKEDPYRAKRTELIAREKEAKEPIERELREKARKYKIYEEKTRQIDKEEQEINEKLLDTKITDTQTEELNKRMNVLGEDRKKVELELATVKKDLEPAIRQRRERAIVRAGLDTKQNEVMSKEDRENAEYQKEKTQTMNSNFDKASIIEYKNVKKRIENREQHIKDINDLLDKTPDNDFGRRLELLNELDKENNMLEADRETKSDLDRGIKPTEIEMKKDAKEKLDDEEYRQTQFDKATKEVREVTEEIKKQEGRSVVENPEVAAKEKDRDSTVMAAAVAMAYDSPEPGPDTLIQDVGQFAVTKCVIDGLDNQVRDMNDPKDAQEYVNQDKEIKEADRTLDKVQEQVQKELKRG